MLEELIAFDRLMNIQRIWELSVVCVLGFVIIVLVSWIMIDKYRAKREEG